MAAAAVHADLIARAQQGDVRAFEQLIGEHVRQVRRFALGFARTEADAADLAQEALIKVYRSIRTFRFQSAFSTWLYAVVRNVCLDAAKSRAGRDRAAETTLEHDHVEGPNGGHDGDADRPDVRLAREQERQRVWDAIRQIPEEFRDVLTMFDIEGMSHDEVAAITKTPVGTVKSRLFRGRDHLRRLLGQAGAGTGNPGRRKLVTRSEEAPPEGTTP